MAESGKPTRRRARRSTATSRALAEARQRNAEQLATQRAQEQRVWDALEVFFGASDEIAAAEQECQRRVGPHERAIAQLREQLEQTVAGALSVQARAALTIHEADRTVEQVGELLKLGEKAARRLIAAGRDAAAAENPEDRQEDGAGDADRPRATNADHLPEPHPRRAAAGGLPDVAGPDGRAGSGDERREQADDISAVVAATE